MVTLFLSCAASSRGCSFYYCVPRTTSKHHSAPPHYSKLTTTQHNTILLLFFFLKPQACGHSAHTFKVTTRNWADVISIARTSCAHDERLHMITKEKPHDLMHGTPTARRRTVQERARCPTSVLLDHQRGALSPRTSTTGAWRSTKILKVEEKKGETSTFVSTLLFCNCSQYTQTNPHTHTHTH